jgi:hypothetical protein
VEIIKFLEPCSAYGTKDHTEIFNLILSIVSELACNQLALAGESCLRRNATVVSCAWWYSLVVFSVPSHWVRKPGFTPARSKLSKFSSHPNILVFYHT